MKLTKTNPMMIFTIRDIVEIRAEYFSLFLAMSMVEYPKLFAFINTVRATKFKDVIAVEYFGIKSIRTGKHIKAT